MSTLNKTTTIKTQYFNNFTWKRLPLEHDYINIVFCVSNYKNKDKTNNFLENINNENIKKAIKYILNIMPYQCIVNIDNYNNFINNINNIEISSPILDKINNNKMKIDNKNNINILKNKVKKNNNKKTYIFTYESENDCDNVKDTNNENYLNNNDNDNDNNDNNNYNNYKECKYNSVEQQLKNILNYSINIHFNEIHNISIGEINNIPNNILSLADYIFFENVDILNTYLTKSNHNIRIKTGNAYVYLIDKCNYEYYQLFNFNKHII
jgi:hypothetical protein